MTPPDGPPRPSRRRALGAGAALLASLAGCSSPLGTGAADTRTPDRSPPPPETPDGGSGGPGSAASTPTVTARSVEPLHLQVTGDLWPLVRYLTRAWNANRSPEGAGVWPAAAEALGTDERLADHFAADHGIDPTETRSEPPFGLLASVADPGPTAGDLAADRVDAGETERAAIDSAASEADEWPELVGHTVAREGQAFVVSPALAEAGVTRLTAAEIRDIYAGEIETWAAVGGPDREPYVVGGPTGSPNPRIEREFFRRQAQTGLDVRFGHHHDRAEIVEKRDDAIAYLGVGVAADRFEAPTVVVDGAARDVPDPGYPTTYPAAVYTRGDPDAREAAVIDALRSPIRRRITTHEPTLVVGAN